MDHIHLYYAWEKKIKLLDIVFFFQYLSTVTSKAIVAHTLILSTKYKNSLCMYGCIYRKLEFHLDTDLIASRTDRFKRS